MKTLLIVIHLVVAGKPVPIREVPFPFQEVVSQQVLDAGRSPAVPLGKPDKDVLTVWFSVDVSTGPDGRRQVRTGIDALQLEAYDNGRRRPQGNPYLSKKLKSDWHPCSAEATQDLCYSMNFYYLETELGRDIRRMLRWTEAVRGAETAADQIRSIDPAKITADELLKKAIYELKEAHEELYEEAR